MILRDTLSVQFQSNELLDLSLNTRLALGITEKETRPGEWRVSVGEDWEVGIRNRLTPGILKEGWVLVR